MISSRFGAVICLAVLGSLVSASSGHAQTAPANDAVALAKADGKVVIYNGSSVNLLDSIIGKFESRYGIKVERLDARSPEIRERIRTEQAAGRSIADVTINITETLKQQYTDGQLQPYDNVPSVTRIRSDVAKDEGIIPFAIVKWAILLSNRLVDAKDEPRSWQDLLDPKWRGKILMDDPRTLGGGRFLFAATYKKFGREFHEKLAAQQPVFSPNVAVNERRIAQGEYAIYLPQVVPNLGRLAGLPVRAIAPSEGLPYGVSGAAIVKNPPHKNAATLFLEFVLSDEAQNAVVMEGYTSVTGYTSDQVPEALRKLNGGPLLGTATASDGDVLLKAASELYK